MFQKNKLTARRCGPLLVALLATCVVAWPQNPPPPPPGGHFPGGPGRFGDDALRFMGFEGRFGNRTITGAPFTANFSGQTSQTLADGNKIQHSSKGSMARDSQGRTRLEVTLSAIGPWSTSGLNHGIFINDPVANVRYILEPDQKIAISLPVPTGRNNGKNGPPPSRFQSDNKDVTSTSLGTQVMAGVSAEGKVVTRTIPAGVIGNLNSIAIRVETWYSADLQMNVSIKRSDPRMGATDFELSDIQRQEPDATSFQVPSGYTVKQGGKGPGQSPHGPPPPQ
jgi:hypothetical protein